MTNFWSISESLLGPQNELKTDKTLSPVDLEEGKCQQSDLFFALDRENLPPDALETHFWVIFLSAFDSFSWLGDGLQRDLLVTLDRENHSPDAGSTLLHPDLQTVQSRQEHNKTPTPTAKHPAPELGAAVLPPLGGIQLNPPHQSAAPKRRPGLDRRTPVRSPGRFTSPPPQTPRIPPGARAVPVLYPSD